MDGGGEGHCVLLWKVVCEDEVLLCCCVDVRIVDVFYGRG